MRTLNELRNAYSEMSIDTLIRGIQSLEKRAAENEALVEYYRARQNKSEIEFYEAALSNWEENSIMLITAKMVLAEKKG